MERTIAWLRGRLDIRSVTHLRGVRLGRIAALVVTLLVLAYETLSLAFAPVNIAYRKAVAASSLATIDARGLVDGLKDGAIGVRTQPDGHPWVQIDLGSVATIDRIVVYNRGDRDLTVGLPYEIETSSDGTDFAVVARRDSWFGDGSFRAPPWTAKGRLRARFVRIRAQNYVALSEVEVFGKP